MAVNFLELLAGTSVDLKGLEDGLQKAEQMASQFGVNFGKTVTEGPSQALKNLSRLTTEELASMSAAVARNATATRAAYDAKIAGSAQVKVALQQEIQVQNELIKRQEAYVASLKAGTAASVEAAAGLTEMKVKAQQLNAEMASLERSTLGPMLAITAAIGAVITALGKAIKTTADYGLEMEHMSNRMGMTVEQTATLVGIMERFGVNANTGARAMQLLSTQVKQTQDSLDPFATKLGRTLGTLRDTSGQVLNMGQVLDLIRQKVSGASTDTERLQIATSLLGSRIGGQLVPMLRLSNEEWEKQKESVMATLGPMEEAAKQALAYKEATASLEQAFRGLQISVGTKLLPFLTELISDMASLTKEFMQGKGAIAEYLHDISSTSFEALGSIIKGITSSVLWLGEKTGQFAEGTTKNFDEMGGRIKKNLEDAGKATEEMTEEQKNLNNEISLNEQNERKVVQMVREKMSLMEKAHALGIEGTGQAEQQKDLEEALVRLTQQRAQLEKELVEAQTKGTPLIRENIERNLLKNRVEAAQLAADVTLKGYKEEELQLKAMGESNLQNEIQLLQRKLADERVVGDERLKTEAELYQKRKQYEEEVVKYGRQLGMMSVDQEIEYRKRRAAELFGKGDIFGAAQELVKARDLVTKQMDQEMEFEKKLRIVSIQDEIQYQRQKLNLFRGNAEEEMKILEKIADLDKQLYDKRLKFSLDYTQNAINAYRELMKATGQAADAISGPKEEQTFERAAVDAERARIQQARELERVAAHGGTEEARETAVKQAQDIMKQFEEMQQVGKEASEGMKDAVRAARDVMKAAGAEEVRIPGAPSPVADLKGELGAGMKDVASGIRNDVESAIRNASTGMKDASTGMKDASTGMKDAAAIMKSASRDMSDAIGELEVEAPMMRHSAPPVPRRETPINITPQVHVAPKVDVPEFPDVNVPEFPTADIERISRESSARTTAQSEAMMRQIANTLRDSIRPAYFGGADSQVAVKQAQEMVKQFEEIGKLGKETSAGMREAVSAARDVLRAASLGEEVRTPGGPSPLAGSLLGPIEGLSTSSLARGTDVPRLDTSFTDMAIRIRDVLLGTIPNIQNFSNQLAVATRQMSTLTGMQNNPGIVGPGGAFSLVPTQGSPPFQTGSSTPAPPPTIGPGVEIITPTQQVGIGASSQASSLNAKIEDLTGAIKDLPDKIVAGQQSQQAANAQSISSAIAEALAKRGGPSANVNITMDPNTGDLIINRFVQELSQ
jgi:hypothetical protein